MYPIPPFDLPSKPGTAGALQQDVGGWVSTNPLYRSTGEWHGAVIPSAPPVDSMYTSGSLVQAYTARKGSYRDLLPDSSPLAILKHQALSSGGAPPRFGSPVPLGHAPAPGQLIDPLQPMAPSFYPPVPGASHAYDEDVGVYRGAAIPAISQQLQAYPQVPGAQEAPRSQPPLAPAFTALQEYQSVKFNVAQQAKPNVLVSSNELADASAKAARSTAGANNVNPQVPGVIKTQGVNKSEGSSEAQPEANDRVAKGSDGGKCKDSAQAQVLTPFLNVLAEHRRACEAPTASPHTVLRSLDTVQQKITQNVGHLYTCFKEQQDRERAKLRHVSQALKTAEDQCAKAGTRSSSKGGGKTTNILFLPYTLHPAQRKTRWFGILLASWQAKRTLWLAIIWACIFVLAVSLLIGLLVPWHKPPKPAQFSVAPTVLALNSASIDMTIRLDRPAIVYYAVIPSGLLSQHLRRRRTLLYKASTTYQTSSKSAEGGWFSWAPGWLGTWVRQQQIQGRGRQLSQLADASRSQWGWDEGNHGSQASANPWARMLATAGPPPPPPLTPPPSPPPPAPPPPLGLLGWVRPDDVVGVGGGRANSLSRYAAACGRVEVQERTQNAYNLTVGTASPSLECATTLGGSLDAAYPGQGGSGLPGQCVRCPSLRPGTLDYTVLLVSVREGKKQAISELQVVEIAHVAGGTWQTTVNGVVMG